MNCYFLESTAFAKLFVQEPGTDCLIRLMESVEDNRKLIAASAPLEVYAAIRRRERAGDISTEDAAAAFEILRIEAARMVQEPLNPAVLEAARQLLDRTRLRWTDALQLGAALVAREMFRGTEIIEWGPYGLRDMALDVRSLSPEAVAQVLTARADDAGI